MHLFFFFFLLLFSCSIPTAFANERLGSPEQLRTEGYRPISYKLAKKAQTSLTIPAAHSLVWPVHFESSQASLANAMAQFQPFGGDPYFHGGCDLRVAAGASIYAPIAGSLEAGHYSYSVNADGSMEKYWKPWPETGDNTYFEVALVADSGIRYEFHHVNRRSLPSNIVTLLNHGGGKVEAGTLLGHAIYWPDGTYHHIHYNIILPNGTRLNPEFVSPLIPDHLAPDIIAAYGISSSGKSLAFQEAPFPKDLKAFAIAVIDKQDQNIYEHPASFVKLQFLSGKSVQWDFRQTLSSAEGRFPPLWEVFLEFLRTPEGKTLYTEGGYGMGLSIIQLRKPAEASGPFTIELTDMAGNTSLLRGNVSER